MGLVEAAELEIVQSADADDEQKDQTDRGHGKSPAMLQPL
jgi:hypothetical protein